MFTAPARTAGIYQGDKVKVFHSEPISKCDFEGTLSREEGLPLQAWWAEVDAAYKAAGCPTRKIVVRHRMVMDNCDAGTHDGLRDGKGASTGYVLEVGVR